MTRLTAAGVIVVFCLVTCFTAGRAVGDRAATLRLPAGDARTPLLARLSEGLSLRRAAGDRGWMDVLLYAGDTSFALDKGSKLFGLARRATDHDPSFREVYLFGGSMLMWQCNRPEEAAALLRRGIEANPADPKLKMYLAAFAYSRLKDLSGEIAALEPLAFEPGAPFIMKRILANAWEAKAREAKREPDRRQALGRAIGIWRHVWLTTDSEEERRWVLIKCGKLGLDPRGFETPTK